jgi:predicted PurR-regulated permease PerM
VVSYASLVAWVAFDPVFRLPYPLLLATSVGLLELVPVVGSLASATIVGLIAIQQKSCGLLHSWLLLPSDCGFRLTISSFR